MEGEATAAGEVPEARNVQALGEGKSMEEIRKGGRGWVRLGKEGGGG